MSAVDFFVMLGAVHFAAFAGESWNRLLSGIYLILAAISLFVEHR